MGKNVYLGNDKRQSRNDSALNEQRKDKFGQYKTREIQKWHPFIQAYSYMY